MASSLISINEATIEELQQLEGIGPKRSIYIVDFRNRVDLIRNTFDLATATGLSIKAQDGFLPRVNLDKALLDQTKEFYANKSKESPKKA